MATTSQITYFFINDTHAAFKGPTAVWASYIAPIKGGNVAASMASCSVWIVPGTHTEE